MTSDKAGGDGFFINCFEDFPDPRSGKATRLELLEGLTIALVAPVCGTESCVDFADFAEMRQDALAASQIKAISRLSLLFLRRCQISSLDCHKK